MRTPVRRAPPGRRRSPSSTSRSIPRCWRSRRASNASDPRPPCGGRSVPDGPLDVQQPDPTVAAPNGEQPQVGGATRPRVAGVAGQKPATLTRSAAASGSSRSTNTPVGEDMTTSLVTRPTTGREPRLAHQRDRRYRARCEMCYRAAALGPKCALSVARSSGLQRACYRRPPTAASMGLKCAVVDSVGGIRARGDTDRGSTESKQAQLCHRFASPPNRGAWAVIRAGPC